VLLAALVRAKLSNVSSDRRLVHGQLARRRRSDHDRIKEDHFALPLAEYGRSSRRTATHSKLPMHESPVCTREKNSLTLRHERSSHRRQRIRARRSLNYSSLARFASTVNSRGNKPLIAGVQPMWRSERAAAFTSRDERPHVHLAVESTRSPRRFFVNAVRRRLPAKGHYVPDQHGFVYSTRSKRSDQRTRAKDPTRLQHRQGSRLKRGWVMMTAIEES